jgi:hypothetical protein
MCTVEFVSVQRVLFQTGKQPPATVVAQAVRGLGECEVKAKSALPLVDGIATATEVEGDRRFTKLLRREAVAGQSKRGRASVVGQLLISATRQSLRRQEPVRGLCSCALRRL